MKQSAMKSLRSNESTLCVVLCIDSITANLHWHRDEMIVEFEGEWIVKVNRVTWLTDTDKISMLKNERTDQ
jgi:hypothetical protein